MRTRKTPFPEELVPWSLWFGAWRAVVPWAPSLETVPPAAGRQWEVGLAPGSSVEGPEECGLGRLAQRWRWLRDHRGSSYLAQLLPPEDGLKRRLVVTASSSPLGLCEWPALEYPQATVSIWVALPRGPPSQLP